MIVRAGREGCKLGGYPHQKQSVYFITRSRVFPHTIKIKWYYKYSYVFLNISKISYFRKFVVRELILFLIV